MVDQFINISYLQNLYPERTVNILVYILRVLTIRLSALIKKLMLQRNKVYIIILCWQLPVILILNLLK